MVFVPVIAERPQPFDAPEAALLAHCKRTALWAFEMAQCLGFSSSQCNSLRTAALAHHWPYDLLESESMTRLTAELGLSHSGAVSEPSGDQQASLRVERSNACAESPAPENTSDVLAVANEFDELLEFAPYLSGGIREAIQEGGDWPSVRPMRAALRHSTREELLSSLPRLPIYPAVAIRALRLASQSNASLSQLEAIVRQDQVLTSHILSAVNSTSVGLRFPVENLTNALNCLGTLEARKIICAAAIGPLFSTPALAAIWRHSLESAVQAERFANLCGRVPADQAFVAGLVHDIGRLALALSRRSAVECLNRLEDAWCPAITAELLVFDMHHAEVGAAVLERWGLPKAIAEGVASHHEPEQSDSDLASLLYLVEFCGDSDEDLPSVARLRAACKTLGIPMSELFPGRGQPPGTSQVLIPAEAV